MRENEESEKGNNATITYNKTIDLWGYLNEQIDKERTQVTSFSVADNIFTLPQKIKSD